MARGVVAVPRWLRLLALMPAVPGVVLVVWVWRDAPAEYHALQAENALIRGENVVLSEELAAGMTLDPHHPRLLAMAAAFAGRQRGVQLDEFSSGPWAEQSAEEWGKLVARQPYSALGHREYALAQTHRGWLEESLPFHLRGIALDPDYATGYEYLGYYFLRLKQYDEALRLFRLARPLPGAVVTPQDEEYLRQSGP